MGLDDIVATGMKVLDKFIPDPEAKAKFESELRDSLQGWDKQQNEVNAVEAQNSNIFVSGWRPAIGWVGAIGLLYQYQLRPVAVGAGWHDLPTLDSSLMELVTAMLGMAGLRTYEKTLNVHAK
jgi:hypothetical protein